MKYLITLSILLSFFSSCQSQRIQEEKDLAEKADMLLYNGKIAIMNEEHTIAQALAIKDGLILDYGSTTDMKQYMEDATQQIDLKGRTAIPGLNDSHLHVTRGGRFYNLELRWDGLGSLKKGLQMIKEQAQRTPQGQWVRVIGGWSPYQFKERRMPTIKELNEVASNTPVFVLFLYSQGFLNAKGLEVLGITKETVPPVGGRYEFVDGGAILHAEPDPTILYKTISSLPLMSDEDQLNSTLQFYRELNRLGITSAIDAGGGGHLFPNDYKSTRQLADQGVLPLHISYYLFPQKPNEEYQDFQEWVSTQVTYENFAKNLRRGYSLAGGGEFLVWSAGDFENFMAPRPELDTRPNWKPQLRQVTNLLVEKDWPMRIHATYSESMAQILDVFEEIKNQKGKFVPRWAFDHAETAGIEDLQRTKDLGGGIAIQNRMAYAAEYFVERYGKEQACYVPPLRKMLDIGLPVGAGTDGTRVSSYNPWPALYWMVSGKSVGGLKYMSDDNLLSREEALMLYTKGSAWFSQEENVKGTLEKGMLADLAVLSADYFTVPEDTIKSLVSVLTVLEGKVVYGAEEFKTLNPGLPDVSPVWSPVRYFGGYQQ
ncbi:amidohydrolase [Catalinimonas niigatensis]|uniref:amidohydrolase n=1 Tax=Catalinimonas niigatensis TaxID=1397264 RepID=UPI0026656311|nr:amidohydrolase [Catalinimonas niigatensis]WPP48728.1 amidohydrolase [Catalinimonas niigatensis]